MQHIRYIFDIEHLENDSHLRFDWWQKNFEYLEILFAVRLGVRKWVTSDLDKVSCTKVDKLPKENMGTWSKIFENPWKL